MHKGIRNIHLQNKTNRQKLSGTITKLPSTTTNIQEPPWTTINQFEPKSRKKKDKKKGENFEHTHLSMSYLRNTVYAI